MSTHLVTGGAGFIGSALVRRLVRDGHRVRVLDDASRGHPSRLADVASAIDLLSGDVRDPGVVASACAGIDTVWHLAAVNGTEFFYSRPELVLEVGVKGIMNVIDGVVRHRVSELFVASSSEVYQTPPRIPTDETVPLSIPDPSNPRYSYAASKIISELLAINNGRRLIRRVVIFRPHNVYGPDMGWEHVVPQLILRMRDLARSSDSRTVLVPIQGTGDETRAFMYLDDTIAALMTLYERAEHLGIYHVGTDSETRIADLAFEIGRYFGRTVEIEPGPLARGGAPRRCPDVSKLRALGYTSQTDLREGLQPTIRWYDDNANARKVNP